MAFVATDPRSKLAGTPAASAPEQFGTAEYVKFYETDPQIQSETERTWLARGQNFVIAYSELAPGAVLERADNPDEYVVLVPDAGTPVEARAGDETVTAEGGRVIIVPPGASSLRAEQGGRVVRVFSAEVSDLADQQFVRVHTSQPVEVNTGESPALSLSVLESVLNGISAL